MSHPIQRSQRDVAFAALNGPDVCPMKLAFLGTGFLRQPEPPAQSLQIACDNGIAGGRFHERQIAKMPTI
jgi:hypothetical protein